MEKLTSYEGQQIIDDRMTWNIVHKKTGNNGKQATLTEDLMNHQIKQLQKNIDANNKCLASLPYGNDSNDNSVDPSESINERKAKKQNFQNEWSARGGRHETASPRVENKAMEEILWLLQGSNLQPTKDHKWVTGNISYAQVNDKQELWFQKVTEMQQDLSNIIEGVL